MFDRNCLAKKKRELETNKSKWAIIILKFQRSKRGYHLSELRWKVICHLQDYSKIGRGESLNDFCEIDQSLFCVSINKKVDKVGNVIKNLIKQLEVVPVLEAMEWNRTFNVWNLEKA